jgi:hypothetical protein
MMKVSCVEQPVAEGEMSRVIYAPAIHNYSQVLIAHVCVSAEEEKGREVGE